MTATILRPRWPIVPTVVSQHPFTLTATTTTPAETVTITRLTVNSPMTLYWGDGQSQVLPANSTAAISHVYATAGAYQIVLHDARRITQLHLDNAKFGGLNTAQLAQSRITYFMVNSITGSTINTQHMAGWTPTHWHLHSMPAGGTYTINTQHMSGWTPTYWYLHSMPAGGAYTINTQHMSGWTPTDLRLFSMPAGDTSLTIAADDFAGFVRCTSFYCHNNGLTTTQVDALLWGLYQAASSRSVSGGTINLGGSNAAPSGTFQAATSCPVTVATPGKEIAHELLNNGCGGINLGRVWATVTFTA